MWITFCVKNGFAKAFFIKGSENTEMSYPQMQKSHGCAKISLSRGKIKKEGKSVFFSHGKNFYALK
ncbi:hypothetical protein [Christensenella tenuis]|uniref:Uncharacterized protein n=1 Tax=Christensenella tenuis TaxID=2763033 RepID=A0ABR7EHU5_9FIRM|nr:hypothetical protein [Christensenella tenuis]MBC5649342.1 hypothetical protein [Christensenella tenuis]